MAKHFTKQHTASGYAAMGNSLRRPRIKGGSNRNVKEAIAAERERAARQARIGAGKKK